jgi:uncharacterized membrane protein YcjF (UPF0283 family)
MVSDRGWKLIVWMIFFTFLTLLTLGLRFWAIQVQKRAFRIDDWLVLGAFVSVEIRIPKCILSITHELYRPRFCAWKVQRGGVRLLFNDERLIN